MKMATLFRATMIAGIAVSTAFIPGLKRGYSKTLISASDVYSTPDQPARFAKGKAENNKRMLDIDSVYNPAYLKGKVVLVTGGNRGIGLAVTEELVKQGAKVIVTTRAPTEIPGVKQVISGIEMTDDACGKMIADALGSQKIDILINNAGYCRRIAPHNTLLIAHFSQAISTSLSRPSTRSTSKKR